MALDILHDNWGPYTHTEVENALKAYLANLETRINQAIQEGGVGLEDLSQEVRDLLDKADKALQPGDIASWAKAQNKPGYTVSEVTGVEGFQNLLAKLQDMDQKIQAAAQSGDVPDDEMSSTSEKPVQNKVIKAYVDAAVQAVQTALNNLIGGNVQGAIDTFNEVVDFLNGIDTDDPTLSNQLLALSNSITALQTALAGKISGIKANGASETLPVDQDGVVELPPAGSTIFPATNAPSMDGTANVGSSAKYAREDHVHPHDTSKQDTLTFDNAPTAGSDNPVKSGGIKTALDAKANATDVPTNQDMADAIDDALGEAQVTVVPEGSVGIISSLGSDSDEDALSASMGKKLKVAILTILSSLGNYAFPNGKPVIDWGDDTSMTFTVSKTIGTGLSATGGDTDVELGDSLEVTIAITNNLYIVDEDNIVVTMGGSPVAGAWDASTMKVTIAAVTGNVVINVPSMSYVDVDGSNNQLAFFLDCKNRGGQAGHWIDLIGNKDFALTDVTEADDGMVFNGSTSKGVASGSLDVYYYNNTYGSATIEAVVDMSSFTPSSGQRLPILANILDGRVAASFRTTPLGVQLIACSTNATGVDDPNNNFGFFFTNSNKSFGTTGGTDGGIAVVDGIVLDNPRIDNTSSPNRDVHDFVAGLSSSFAVGYGNIGSTNYYFKGKILAIRVYKTKLTAQQIIYNHNIDKKRFNLA